MLAAFAYYVRQGGVSQRKQHVCAKTVLVALRSISTQLQLDGEQNLVVDADGKYPKVISQLLDGFRRDDPPTQPKLAIPLAVPLYLLKAARSRGEREKAIADLALIAFYFLLRMGEYTYHKPSERRRTQQFRVSDIALWNNNKRLNPLLPAEYLMRFCTSATLSISNQKNGKRSQVIHHEALHTPGCPIQAIIRQIKHIQAHTSEQHTTLGSYFSSIHAPERTILASAMNTAIKNAVYALGLHRYGLLTDHVGGHSLQAGGAMAMHLTGVQHNIIKKMGHWSSDSFLIYTHEQISAFLAGISKQMTQSILFHNIAFQPAQGPTLLSSLAA